MTILHVFKSFFCDTPKKKVKNFFDLPARERKRIIKKAGQRAQKEQERLLRRYNARFGSI